MSNGNNGKLQVIGGQSHPELTAAICRALGVAPVPRESFKFKNDNRFVKIGVNVRGCDVFVVQTSVPPVDEGLIELLIMIDALRHASARRITAVMPYMPYVRSDKKDQPRISITARLVADMLEASGADRVLVMDLHCGQEQGFFRMPTDQLLAKKLLCAHFKKRDLRNAVVVAPDAGEAKGIGGFANRLKLNIAIIDKRRKGNDDRAYPTNLIGDVKGRDTIIFDDEISTAGTVVESAEFLLERGAKSVSVGATHGVLVGPAVDRLSKSRIREVVVTDTVPIPPEKRFEQLTVLPVAPIFAQVIRRIHNDRSVGALFR